MKILTLILWSPVFLAMALAWLIVISKRARRLHAGAGGSNFPSGVPPIGTVEAFGRTGLIATLAAATFYTAQVSGLYMIGMACHITATDGTGTITLTMKLPHAVPIIAGVSPAAPTDTITPPAIEQDPALSATPADVFDGFCAAVPAWLNAGDVVTLAAATSSLTGATFFNLYLTVQRLL
jgi:hypothetical protein